MSISRNLGGDRLGSGNKMNVHMHGFERSSHDTGFLFRSTMSPGTLVPFMSELALTGDTLDIDLGCNVMTHPTVGPLFGSYKVQLDVFQCPIRLYNSLLHNNALNIGRNIAGVKFPVIEMKATSVEGAADVDNAQINPSSLLKYVGISGVGVPGEIGDNLRTFNAIAILAYWEIVKQYYANKQEEIGAVIHTSNEQIVKEISGIMELANFSAIVEFPNEEIVQIAAGGEIRVSFTGPTPTKASDIYFITSIGVKPLSEIASLIGFDVDYEDYKFNNQLGGFEIYSWRYRNNTDALNIAPKVSTFPLENIDTMRVELLRHSSTVAPFKINSVNLEPYRWLYEQPNDIPLVLNSQEGLAVKTYQSDMFNNWLNEEWIDGPTGVNAISAIDVSGGLLTMDSLNLAKKVYNMLNRIAVSGGTYDDYLDVQYGETRYTRITTPMYCGGLIKELIFQEVVSNAAAEGQELGTIAGKGVMSGKHKGGSVRIKVDEPSYIIGLVSLTPRIDYSQGNKWDVHLKSMADLHVPSLDEIGFQDLISEQMHWAETKNVDGTWVQKSVGKQPAWLNYMTNVNRTFGNFAIQDSEMFMNLNRRYELDEELNIKDLTTYIDPVKFNHIFADTAIDAQNFWCQISVDMTARRKMSAKVMPNV